MILYDCLYPKIKSGWYERLRTFAGVFADFGGDLILLPPPFRTTYTGSDNMSLGYDPISDLDIGQWESLRGGTAEDLQSLAREALRHGLRLMFDLPMHQYGGFPIVERNGKGKRDRKLAYKPSFLFRAAPDQNFERAPADGLRVPYQHSKPADYLRKMKIQCTAWLMHVTAGFGLRLDEAKDMDMNLTHRLAASIPGFKVAEAYTGSNAQLDSYHRQSGLPVFDFGSHFAYRAVSQGAGLDALVYTDRYCHMNPSAAVPFVDNHDTDGADGVVNFKGWFYLDACTQAALACSIYAGDYELYGLAPLIDNYLWIGKRLAVGNQAYHVISPDVLIWSRDGNGGELGNAAGVLCGISRDPFNTRWVWTDTPWRNCWIRNYARSGGPNVWVYPDGRACIPLPPNSFSRADNGVAYSLLNQDGPLPKRELHIPLRNPLDFSGITVTL
ncbi:Alpha amylase, catalytic domain protein [Terriglobus roseus DSM 18391]|uniref:Alpha amylase, catalytic domain protein n=1 Tax=Terriglobus roseus (strain DSM 18391 / NRRL B-41598 / KBS 63) TaxID=926566 RepID=I3ZHQ1_TERRK|nr:alpha-amylase [Terriglobus roseus]AFL88427.1 Alpha amylase, catalytic domain protein [Terriglobus roseus DSM 18391]AFL88769.1 Alpha amylase, catalytic domain protein [Terriglobus roseus DSM 18391]